MVLPKPLRRGFRTEGPPLSFHAIAKMCSPFTRSILPRITTFPVGADSAPYFAAFVASSWTMSANCWAAGVLTSISGHAAVLALFDEIIAAG
jgi:hypothetical protein